LDKNRVIIAHSHKTFSQQLKKICQQVGYLVIGETKEGRDTLQSAFQQEPDIIIMEDNLPGNEGRNIAGLIDEHRLAPLVLVVENQKELLTLIHLPEVYGILTLPLQEIVVLTVLETALVAFQRIKELENEVKELRKTIEARKIIERAKGILMEKRGLNERTAYKYLQKMSMDHCIPLEIVAKKIILKLQS